MNEIALSNDLKTIEFEINQHRMSASNSIIEIGKRLNHVKENDLSHGKFMDWIENELDMSYTTANRYMKVAKEFPDLMSTQNLSLENLFLITTLPEKEKENEIKKVKEGGGSTTREIRDLKKQLKEQWEQHERQLKAKDEVIDKTYERLRDLQTKEPKIIEKVIEKPVAPHDYDYLKNNNKELNQNLKAHRESLKHLEERNKFIENQLKELMDQRKEVDDKSAKYDALTSSINELQGKMSDYQKEIVAYKGISETIRIIDNLLDEAAGLIYLDDLEITNNNSYVREQLLRVLNRVDTWSKDMHRKLDKTKIIEGHFTDD